MTKAKMDQLKAFMDSFEKSETSLRGREKSVEKRLAKMEKHVAALLRFAKARLKEEEPSEEQLMWVEEPVGSLITCLPRRNIKSLKKGKCTFGCKIRVTKI